MFGEKSLSLALQENSGVPMAGAVLNMRRGRTKILYDYQKEIQRADKEGYSHKHR
jgi:hypothetical protein